MGEIISEHWAGSSRNRRAASSESAVTDLVHDKNPAATIFGPTGFEEGAQFYTAHAALDQFSSGMLADTENLRKLAPPDVAKLLAAKSSELMTGDAGTNTLIQGGLMERMGPVMATIAKARVDWQQDNTVNAQAQAHDAAATLYQTTASNNPDAAVVETARTNFLKGRGMLQGETDASYSRYLFTSAQSDLAAGRLYPVNAMKESGSWNLLTEEQRTKLETAYGPASTKANAKAAALVAPRMAALQTNIKMADMIDTATGKPRGFPGGANAVMLELAAINSQVKAISGSTDDLYDYKDYVAGAGSLIDVLVAGKRREETRAEQLTDMKTKRAQEIEDRDHDEKLGAAQIAAGWGTGDINGAIAGKLGTEADFNVLALSEMRAGHLEGSLRAWNTSKWVSPSVATQLQTAVTSSIGSEYNEDVGRSHEQWAKLYAQSPSFAAALYGPMQAPMLRFDTLLRSKVSPQQAFMKAFDPTSYNPIAIPEERKAAAVKSIAAVLSAREPSWFNFGSVKLSPSSLRSTTALLTNRFATLATGDHSLSDELVARQAIAGMEADGSYEHYGAYAWGNKPGTPTLSSLTGLHGAEMDGALDHVMARRFKRAGFNEDPRASDTVITRLLMPNGHPAIHVEAFAADGSGSKSILFTVADLKAYHQHVLDSRFIRSGGASQIPGSRNPQGDKVLARYKEYEAAYEK